MSDRQQSQHAKYNKTPYNNPSNHSIFNHRQFQITGGDQPKTHPKSAPRGRGRTNNRGHSYVGIQRGSHSGYKKHSDINPSKQLPYYIPKERQTTKSKYRRKWVVKDNTQSNVIQIKASNSVQEYVECALDLFAKKTKVICISATGRNVSKAVNCVEIIKRKHHGLHQESSIERNTIKEVWVPLEKFLKDVIIEREVIYVKILLSFDKKLVNKDHIGYQEPISWIDLGDARELHDKMNMKIGKLQNKNDVQQQELERMKGKRSQDFTDMKHKYDEQEEIMNNQTSAYTNIMDKFNELKEKYDVQEIAQGQLQNKYDVQEIAQGKLQNKYDVQEIAQGQLQNKYDVQEIAQGQLQNKYDVQEMAHGKLQDKYDLKQDAYTDIKHEYDEQEEIMNQQTNDYQNNMGKLQNTYDVKQDQFTDMKHEYDTQLRKQEKSMYKKTGDYQLNMGKLQTKYDMQEVALDKANVKYSNDFMGMENKYDAQAELMKENKKKFDTLQDKFDALQKHSEDREENLRLKKNKYDDLGPSELVDVIISIDEQRYGKYRDKLLKRFIEEGVDGSCLKQLSKEDLYAFGITNYKDKLAIYNSIKKLFS